MILHSPFQISPRLLPALRIGDAWINLEYDGAFGNRTRYRYTIDLPNGAEYAASDLYSGIGKGDLEEGFVSLLTFLVAAAESYGYRLRNHITEKGDKESFHPTVVKWAYQHQNDLTMLCIEIEEAVKPLIEE